MDINNKQVGLQIQKARRLKKWSTGDLAAAVNYTPKSIVYAENGQVDLSLEFLLSLCKALEVTPNDLLEGQFPPKEKSLEEEALREELRQMLVELKGDEEPSSGGTRIKDTETALQEIRQMLFEEKLTRRQAPAAPQQPEKKKGVVHW